MWLDRWSGCGERGRAEMTRGAPRLRVECAKFGRSAGGDRRRRPPSAIRRRFSSRLSARRAHLAAEVHKLSIEGVFLVRDELFERGIALSERHVVARKLKARCRLGWHSFALARSRRHLPTRTQQPANACQTEQNPSRKLASHDHLQIWKSTLNNLKKWKKFRIKFKAATLVKFFIPQIGKFQSLRCYESSNFCRNCDFQRRVFCRKIFLRSHDQQGFCVNFLSLEIAKIVRAK